MKRHLVMWAAILALLAAGNRDLLGAATFDETFDMPITETRDVVVDWLNGAGFQIYDQTRSRQLIEMLAEKDSLQLHIAARPHSPLATRISIETIRGGHYALELKKYLDAYINLPSTRAATPAPVPGEVRRYLEAVVCIYAAGVNSEVQLTGFIIDRRGYILCTAHDLEEGQTVSITMTDDRETAGVVTMLHHQADVALIEAEISFGTAVSLQQGRFMLGSGERLYSITCSNGSRAHIEAGAIDGPPRRVSEMPLWQARMHIDHGSSGSPVFDSQGRLAAMVKGRFRGTDAIGFLIPFETLLNFLGRY
jgi:serine protease Do